MKLSYFKYIEFEQAKFQVSVLTWIMASIALFSFWQPNGVDWEYYSSVAPDYGRIYFQREIVSWLIIDLINGIDTSGVLMAVLISTLLFAGTFKLSFVLTQKYYIAILTAVFLAFSNFYLLMSVNGLRQGLSVAFLLFSIERKLAGSNSVILFFILSVFCHNSALLFAPLFFANHVGTTLFLLSSIMLIGLGDAVIKIASKNDNVSVTQNKSTFLALSFVLLSFATYHFFRKKILDDSRSQARYIFLSVWFLLCCSLAFFQSSAAYERLVYTIVPLIVVYSSGFLKYYRPRYALVAVYLLLIALSSWYSLSHPSVRNNFLNM